jgi:hypothetical protein
LDVGRLKCGDRAVIRVKIRARIASDQSRKLGLDGGAQALSSVSIQIQPVENQAIDMHVDSQAAASSIAGSKY